MSAPRHEISSSNFAGGELDFVVLDWFCLLLLLLFLFVFWVYFVEGDYSIWLDHLVFSRNETCRNGGDCGRLSTWPRVQNNQHVSSQCEDN